MTEEKDRQKYDLREEPKIRANLSLTQRALDTLDRIAKSKGMSRSGLVEQYARMLESLPNDEEQLLGESWVG